MAAVPNTEGYVYVVDPAGRSAQRRQVTFGSLAGEAIVVERGLVPGERVAYVVDTQAQVALQ